MTDDQLHEPESRKDEPVVGVGEAQAQTWTPPASQADLDRMIADRVSRERAKYGDYQALKAKAAKFDEAEQQAMTDMQKAVARAEAAERRASELETRQQVADWAAEITKGSPIPAAALRGSSREELEAHFEQLRSLVPDPPAVKGAVGPYVPSEGKAPAAPVGSSPAQQFADLIRQAQSR